MRGLVAAASAGDEGDAVPRDGAEGDDAVLRIEVEVGVALCEPEEGLGHGVGGRVDDVFVHVGLTFGSIWPGWIEGIHLLHPPDCLNSGARLGPIDSRRVPRVRPESSPSSLRFPLPPWGLFFRFNSVGCARRNGPFLRSSLQQSQTMSAPPADTEKDAAQPLALPAPPSAQEEQGKTRTLNVQEENSVALDELGPLIVNSDGVSLSCLLLLSELDPLTDGG